MANALPPCVPRAWRVQHRSLHWAENFAACPVTAILDKPAAQTVAGAAWLPAMPALFVVLWSTGFIGAKYGLPYAEPLTFLALRFGIVAAVMLAVSLLGRAVWPSDWRAAGHTALVGLLIQAIYLGGVYFAISRG